MILDLGLTDYEDAYRIQKDFVVRRKIGEIEDSLIITEHNPVFTLGRVGNIRNLLADEETLAARGIRVMRVDRGGDITCHAPGQLVIYPVIDLKRRGRDLHKYLRDLEEVCIQFLARYGLSAIRVDGMTGAWACGKKIASIGVGASDWVTYHGMSINIKNDLHFFSLINACGMSEVSAISLEAAIGRSVDMEDVKIVLVREFYRIFKAKDEILAH